MVRAILFSLQEEVQGELIHRVITPSILREETLSNSGSLEKRKLAEAVKIERDVQNLDRAIAGMDDFKIGEILSSPRPEDDLSSLILGDVLSTESPLIKIASSSLKAPAMVRAAFSQISPDQQIKILDSHTGVMAIKSALTPSTLEGDVSSYQKETLKAIFADFSAEKFGQFFNEDIIQQNIYDPSNIDDTYEAISSAVTEIKQEKTKQEATKSNFENNLKININLIRSLSVQGAPTPSARAPDAKRFKEGNNRDLS